MSPRNKHVFDAAELEFVAGCSTAGRGFVEAVAAPHLELTVCEIVFGTVPRDPQHAKVLQDVLEALVDTVKRAFLAPDFMPLLGMKAATKTHAIVRRFLEVPIRPLLERLRRFTAEIQAPVPHHPAIGTDKVAVLLRRIRRFSQEKASFADSAQRCRPDRMADLCPIFIATRPPSQQTRLERRAFFEEQAAIHLGDLDAYLGKIRDAELLADSEVHTDDALLPQPIWTTVPDTQWNRVLDASPPGLRSCDVRHGTAALEVLAGTEMMRELGRGEESGAVTAAQFKALVAASTSDQALLNILFRHGIYQDVSGCPFDGMDSPVPAQAFKIYFGALVRSINSTLLCENDRRLVTFMRGLFSRQIEMLVEAHHVYVRVESQPPVSAPAPAPVPNRRRATATPTESKVPDQAGPPETSTDLSVARLDPITQDANAEAGLADSNTTPAVLSAEAADTVVDKSTTARADIAIPEPTDLRESSDRPSAATSEMTKDGNTNAEQDALAADPPSMAAPTAAESGQPTGEGNADTTSASKTAVLYAGQDALVADSHVVTAPAASQATDPAANEDQNLDSIAAEEAPAILFHDDVAELEGGKGGRLSSCTRCSSKTQDDKT
ncbi:hypothetical protein C8R43DRAFT_958500 [Mycena crocata]|nr:hypothetical protein C8R43DRAFT_958500 [Mycena crocata]